MMIFKVLAAVLIHSLFEREKTKWRKKWEREEGREASGVLDMEVQSSK